MQIARAEEAHIPGVARLFDLYRQFYDCDPDLALATRYISDRLKNQESTIFCAIDDADEVIGFVQLYPSFCSVDAIKIFILYDLYVAADIRNAGVGAALMNEATRFAKSEGAGRIDLLTGKDNHSGQHLYEKLGYKKVNEDFYAYSLVT